MIRGEGELPDEDRWKRFEWLSWGKNGSQIIAAKVNWMLPFAFSCNTNIREQLMTLKTDLIFFRWNIIKLWHSLSQSNEKSPELSRIKEGPDLYAGNKNVFCWHTAFLMRSVKPHISAYKATRNFETGEAVLPPGRLFCSSAPRLEAKRKDAQADRQLVLLSMVIPTFQFLYVKNNSSVTTKTNLSKISW